ncbi:hypothetical protein Micbo1qcDRAFT_193121 [Microdochium bolleyi]|uniref:Cyanovirin-N domain-containing protein n=1 Tax=Microdochium bolleyi TaxID=196109 RepID=A0A136J9B1_9PEZI|nr:hypothetical protein Micbo1qcDRAFT_193121 [Microdochium bolleyi]
MQILHLLACLGLATTGTALLTATCNQCHMFNGHGADTNGHLLRCLCARIGGDEWKAEAHFSEIHLNDLIGNSNGNLVWNSRDHRGSCWDFVLHDQHEYWATCRQQDGGERRTMIDLRPMRHKPVPISEGFCLEWSHSE